MPGRTRLQRFLSISCNSQHIYHVRHYKPNYVSVSHILDSKQLDQLIAKMTQIKPMQLCEIQRTLCFINGFYEFNVNMIQWNHPIHSFYDNRICDFITNNIAKESAWFFFHLIRAKMYREAALSNHSMWTGAGHNNTWIHIFSQCWWWRWWWWWWWWWWGWMKWSWWMIMQSDKWW